MEIIHALIPLFHVVGPPGVPEAQLAELKNSSLPICEAPLPASVTRDYPQVTCDGCKARFDRYGIKVEGGSQVGL
jgi:hypothetical protein